MDPAKMDLPHSHFSAFTRFSDMLRETTKRRQSHTPTPPLVPPDSERNFLDTHERDSSRDGRRSSTASYTDRMRHVFSTFGQAPSTTNKTSLGIDDLPVEILQYIFLHLDFRTLLRCQRVCKLWRDLVPGDSPLLAEVLYLKPSKMLQIYSSVPATFDFDFDVSVKSVEQGHQPAGTRFSVGVRKEFSMTRRSMGLIRTSSEIVFHPLIVDFNNTSRRDELSSVGMGGMQRGGVMGSWRAMLVSMPPLREVRIRHAKKKSVVKVLSVRDGEDGVRLGELFEALEEWAKT